MNYYLYHPSFAQFYLYIMRPHSSLVTKYNNTIVEGATVNLLQSSLTFEELFRLLIS